MDSPARRYEQLVAGYGASRAFRRVLIANNGMAATKFIISVRRWLHLTCGDARLIQLVGMATPDDIRANARHVSLADVIEEVRAPRFHALFTGPLRAQGRARSTLTPVCPAHDPRARAAMAQVPGGSNRQNYADVNLIIQLAVKHKCDAIWPGWGHASENPALPLAAPPSHPQRYRASPPAMPTFRASPQLPPPPVLLARL